MLFSSNTTHFVLAIALFASVVFAPWWLSLILALTLSVRWKAWEVIAAGILYDLLWLPSYVALISFDTVPFGTLISIAFVFIFEPLRRQLLLE